MPGGGYTRSKGWEPREGEFFGKRDCRGEGTEEGERGGWRGRQEQASLRPLGWEW